MSGHAPIRIPMEVATKLSVDQAFEALLAATRKPRGFSMMEHRQVVGTVSRERVILRRGTIEGWVLSRTYGEFRGGFVDEQGSIKLRGEFVGDVEVTRRSVVWASAFFLIVMLVWWQKGMPLGWSNLGFGVTILVIYSIVVTLLLRPGRGHQSQNVLAEAELLTEDIDRILND